MIHTLNLSGLRNRQSAIANRKFQGRHITPEQTFVTGFAAGFAVTVIVLAITYLITR